MSTTKRISGDYNIISIDPSGGDNVNIVTNTLSIQGNLDVIGNLTYIETNELKVDDPFITVAANNTGSVATAIFQQQGLLTQTGTTTFAGLRFNNGTLAWEISPSVDANGNPLTAYVAIATGGGTPPGGSNTQVQFNNAGTFGGNSGFTYDYANAKLTLQGYQVFGNTATPANVANSVAVYSNVVGAGGTGLYFTSSSANDELVSKSKAIVFSIIF